MMKRFFVTLVAAIFTMAVSAIGNGTGSNQENAKEYDWTTGELSTSGNQTTWYHIDLTPVMQMEKPKLSLTFRNPGDQTCTLRLAAILEVFNPGDEEAIQMTESSPNKTLLPGQKFVWSTSLSMLKPMHKPGGSIDAYVSINCEQDLLNTAEVFEIEDADEACQSAVAFNMDGQSVDADVLKWFELDLTPVSSKSTVLVLTYTNSGSSSVQVTRGLSPECPTTGVQERTFSVAAGATFRDTIARAMLDLMPKFSYLSVETSGAISVAAQVVARPGSDLTNPCGKSYTMVRVQNADDVVDDTIRVIGGESYKYYRVDKKALLANRHQPRLTIFNNVANAKDLDVTLDVYFAQCPEENPWAEVDYIRHTLSIPAGEIGQMDFAMNMVQQLDTTSPSYDNAQFVYARVKVVGNTFTIKNPLKVLLTMPHIREKDVCKYAADFDWSTNGNSQDSKNTRWYAIDLTNAKKNLKDIEVLIVNRGSETANVTAEVAFSCPYPEDELQSISRNVLAGDTMRKMIEYSKYALYDTIWMGLTSAQPIWFAAKQYDVELKEPDEACLFATPFDWKNGHAQNANDTVWYSVPLDTLRKTELLPYVVITNDAASSLKIDAELTIDCPDSIPNATRSISIHAGGIYSKAVSRDMVNHFDKNVDTVYIRLVGNQSFSFRLELEKPAQGSTCQNAFDFNWTVGNDQTAGDTVWYAIDLTEVKAAVDKELSVSITNRSATSGIVTAELAMACPFEELQKQNLSLAAGQTRTKVLPRSMYASFGDVIWVRLSSKLAFHIAAEPVDAPEFDPIVACEDADEIAFGEVYTPTSDTTWYVFATDTLLHTEYIPQVTLMNGDVKQTVRAEVSYACPVVETMMSRSIVLGANATIEKTMERSMCESIAKENKFAYIRLIGKENFSFRVDLVDPNTGSDCAHAQLLNMNETVVQEAGTTAWYRIAMDQLRTKNTTVFGQIGNIDGENGQVRVSLYTRCDTAALQSKAITLKANELKEQSIKSATLSFVNSEWLYAEIYTAHQDSIRFYVEEDATIDTIRACEDAREWVPNTSYTVPAGTETWFMMDLASLRANYQTEGTIHVYNTSETDTAIVDFWEAWECPVVHEMANFQHKIEPGEEYMRSVTPMVVDGLDYDTVYIRFLASQELMIQADFKFKHEEQKCSEAVLLENGSSTPYYAKKFMWYALHVDSAAIGNRELYLHAENQGDRDIEELALPIYANCSSAYPDTILGGSVAAGEVMHTMLSRDFFQHWGWWPDSTIYFSVFTFENMRLWIDTVPARLTIETDTICGGESLIWRGKTLTETGVYGDTLYNIYGGEQIFVMNLTVGKTYLNAKIDTICQGEVFEWRGRQFSDYLPDTYELVDSLKTLVFGCDSIFTLSLTINPKTPDQHVYDTICKGQTISWGGKEYDKTGSYPDSLTNQFGCDSVILLHLEVVETIDSTINMRGCDSVRIDTLNLTFYGDTTYIHIVPVSKECNSYYRYNIKVDTSGVFFDPTINICSNELPYVWPRNGKKYSAPSGDKPYSYSVMTESGCPITYYFRLEVRPVVDTIIYATVCGDKTYRFKGQELSETGEYYDTLTSVRFECDSVITLRLTRIPDMGDVTIPYPLCQGDTMYAYNGTMVTTSTTIPEWTDCGSVIYHEYTMYPKYEFKKDTAIKEGEYFQWFGKYLRRAGDYDTVMHTIHGCDSIYHLHLVVMSGKYTVNDPIYGCGVTPESYPREDTGEHRWFDRDTLVIDTLQGGAEGGGYDVVVQPIIFHPTYRFYDSPITIREGQKVSWKTYHLGDIVAESKTEVTVTELCYTHYTYNWGCDSVRCLNVTVLPRTYGVDTIDRCDNELPYPYPYVYGGRSYHKDLYADGDYTITRDNFLGGDSVVTIYFRTHESFNILETKDCYVGQLCFYEDDAYGIDTIFPTETPGSQKYALINTQSEFGCEQVYTVRVRVLNSPEGFDDLYDENGEHVAQKVIYQNHLYIIVDDRRYDAMGRRVK